MSTGNLIRNAFQHTTEGRVEIRLTRKRVCIKNSGQTGEESAGRENGYGFGLGMMLVEQIAQKLSLQYDHHSVPGGSQASLFLIRLP